MPFTRITTNFDLSGQRQEVAGRVHELLHQTLQVPQNERLLVFDQNLDSFYPPLNADGRFVVLEITLLPGRDLQAKRELYTRMAEMFKDYGVDPINTRMVLREVPPQNWGIRGGQAACDIL